MAQVGMTVKVGEKAPATAQYKHSAPGCTNTIIVNKDEVMPPCSLAYCSNKGAPWTLNKLLT